MEKRGKIIIGIVIVLVIIVAIVNYGLRDDSELNQEPEQLENTSEEQETAETKDSAETEEDIETFSPEIVLYKEVYPLEAKDLIEANSELIIIDASSKYNLGHISNAISYPLNDGTLENEFGSLDKQVEYLVYSSSDPEGKKAAQLMSDAGFQDVYMLKGSYGLWIQSGYEYEKSYISGYFVFDSWF